MSQVDEIKSKLDIVDIVSEYIQLKPAGSNMRALCPFHREKTPSFMVSRDRQIYKCFGCGESGDAFSFLMKIENIDFPEALKILASKAGVRLARHDPRVASQKNTLLEILDLVCRYWNKFLLESDEAKIAREYIKKRNILEDTIDDFILGYAPDSWEKTSKFLHDRGYKENDIFLAGLTIKKDRGSGFYDRFRHRLIFPIFDIHGNVTGFGGRILEGGSVYAKAREAIAKYINSPLSLVYNKSQTVYNLHNAKQEIKNKEYALVVEGYMDVIACWQVGIKNVIATSGTAFTDQQIKIIKRYTDSLVLSFDADVAGESASDKGIDHALGAEMNLKIVQIPHGKDPDECIQKSPQDFLHAVKNARSIMDYYFEKTLKKFSKDKIEDKKKITQILLAEISKLGNPIEQSYWLKHLSNILDVPENILREQIPERHGKRTGGDADVIKVQDRIFMLEERIMALSLRFHEHIPLVINQFDASYIRYPHLRQLYKNLIIYYTKKVSLNPEMRFDFLEFRKTLINSEEEETQNLAKYIDTLLLLAEKDFLNFESKKIVEEIEIIILMLKKDYLQQELKQIAQRLKQAELDKNDEKISDLSLEYKKIISEIKLLTKNKKNENKA